MASADRSEELLAQVSAAMAERTPLAIVGSGSKRFLGQPVEARPLSLHGHTGIVNYEPTELVLTARAGTPLAQIEAALAVQSQLMPFEPPQFGGGGTLGGAVAAGLSGPRRIAAGTVRDFVLGVRLINGRGESLRFGGEVMKNVAGYDVSRLVTGAMGALGVLTEVSIKVLPAPERELSLCLELPRERISAALDAWTAGALPISAACHDGERFRLRLSGTGAAVDAAAGIIGGEPVEPAGYWRDLRDHALPFFELGAGERLWRLGLPAGTERLDLAGAQLAEWDGRLVWLRSSLPAETVRAEAARRRGHAVLFGGEADGPRFPAPDPVTRQLLQRIKQAMDPQRLFNPGRLYPDL